MKKKNVASMAMAAMMAAGALPMNAWAAPEVNHDEPLTIEVYDVAANYQGMQTGWYAKEIKDRFNIELNIVAPQVSVMQHLFTRHDVHLVIWVILLFWIMQICRIVLM